MQCDPDRVACILRQIEQHLSESSDVFLPTLGATVIGALFAFLFSWILQRSQRSAAEADAVQRRRHELADQDRARDAQRALEADRRQYAAAEHLNSQLAQAVGSLTLLGNRQDENARGSLNWETANAANRLKAEAVAQLRLAELYASQAERIVLESAVDSILSGWDQAHGRAATDLVALNLLHWRIGGLDDAATVHGLSDLQRRFKTKP